MKNHIKKFFLPLEKFKLLIILQLTLKYLFKSRNNRNYPRITEVLSTLFGLVINKLKISRSDNSFANESQIINKILGKIDVGDRILVDIGASDGVTQSSTVKLLFESGYSGFLFEYNSKHFSKLAFVYSSREDVTIAKSKLTPENVTKLFEGLGVPKNFTFLNLDIDSYDLSLLRSLIGGGFSPLLISMEINEIFAPNILFEVLYSEEQFWNGDRFFGCSVGQATKVLNNLGYLLVEIEYNNAFFIHKSCAYNFDPKPDVSSLYEAGYANRQGKKQLFQNNLIIEESLAASIPNEELFIRNLFKSYEGRYYLEVIN